jgi:hypothetical protein
MIYKYQGVIYFIEPCTFTKPFMVNKNEIVVKIMYTTVFLHDTSVDCVRPRMHNKFSCYGINKFQADITTLK